MKIIRYDHAWTNKTANVAVIEENKGRHKENCLCFQGCIFFAPGSPENCGIAQKLFEICVENDVVTPVWECAKFRRMEE